MRWPAIETIFPEPMMRRVRCLAGVFGLAAMAFSHGETLLASVCASAMEMSSARDRSEVMDSSMHMDMDMEGMSMPGQDTGKSDDTRFDACPLALALGQGCLALASLPGVAPRAADATIDHVARRSVDVVRPDLLLTHALFRPPRA